jgi:glucose dehydrogenase
LTVEQKPKSARGLADGRRWARTACECIVGGCWKCLHTHTTEAFAMNFKTTLALAVATAMGAGCTPGSDEMQARDLSPDESAATFQPPGDWRTINRDLAATRFSPLGQINRDNVASLASAWSYQLGGNSTAVPIVIDGVMFLPSRDRVVALDGDTGSEIWSYRLTAPATEGPGDGPGPAEPSASTRGVGYWPGDEAHEPRILFMSRSRMIALDAATGTSVATFGTSGEIDVGVAYGGVPTIYENIAIIGAASGEVPQGPAGNPRAFDVVTGAKLWEFQTVPLPGQPYNETWGDGWEGRGGTNMWGFFAPIDAERGIAYLPIAGPAPNYYGGGRPGNNVFGNSIVAVDAHTGEYLWHFQTVHHDLWDIDLPSAGALVDLGDAAASVPTIAHVGKSSWFYVLNRETGVPHHPVEERPVPAGEVPGEWYSPTQPFPVITPALSRVSFTPDDLVEPEQTSAAHAAACRDFMERSGGFLNEGPFTPFNYKSPDDPVPRSTIQFPGGTGGVNWGGISVDPSTRIAYANAQETSLVGWVQDKDPNVTYSFEAVGSTQPYDRASINGVGPFFTFNAPLSGEYDENGRPVGPTLPCQEPPWGSLVAVDVESGAILWRSVLGINEALPAEKQLVGNSGSAGPSVTAGGLVFVGATRDERFRAFDAATGEELWMTELPSTGNANPMSYLGASGRQYVAIVAGDTVNAFALP